MPFDGLQLGNYRLLRLIGSGGMGEVYVAEDVRTPRQIAVKIARIDAQSFGQTETSSDIIRLFHREMQVIIALDHPNILPLIDFGEVEYQQQSKLLYIVMPYRSEGSLSNWLAHQNISGPLPLKDVTIFLLQAADALQHAHEHQIVHQDVKLANFLVREHQTPSRHPDLLLTDFGIASITSSTSMQSLHFRGTPSAMPPEQWEGKPVPASDQYALAIMTYQLLTGRPPFIGGPEQVMMQHFTKQPEPPSQHNPLLTSGIDDVLLRALAKSPEQRYPSILAFAQAFQQQINEPASISLVPALTSEETPTALQTSPTATETVLGITQTPEQATPPLQTTIHPLAKQVSPARKLRTRAFLLALVALLLLIPIGVIAAGQLHQGQMQSERATAEAVKNSNLAHQQATSRVATATALAPASAATQAAIRTTATAASTTARIAATEQTTPYNTPTPTPTVQAVVQITPTPTIQPTVDVSATATAACFDQASSLGPYTFSPAVYLLPSKTPWFSTSSGCKNISVNFSQLTAPVQIQVCFTDKDCKAWVSINNTNQWYVLATNPAAQTAYRFGINATKQTTIQFAVAA
jgi:eukaryotic-like serine/threonine-protein kinase